MRKGFALLLICFLLLPGCGVEGDVKDSTKEIAGDVEKKEDNIPEVENDSTSAEESVKEEGLVIDYSTDPTANEFIMRYNELNPDSIITRDMVSCPPNSGIYLTIIKFEYMDFTIGEGDGSSTFHCESMLEYNDENTEGFFDEAFYMIQAVENNRADADIEQLLLDLQEGEHPFYNSASFPENKRLFSFKAPGDWRTVDGEKKQLTYQLTWGRASLY